MARVELGDSQLPDLSMQFFYPIFVNYQCLPTASFKNTKRDFKQRPLPLIDHLRIRAEPACKLSNRLLTLQSLKRDFRFELRRMVLLFRHL